MLYSLILYKGMRTENSQTPTKPLLEGASWQRTRILETTLLSMRCGIRRDRRGTDRWHRCTTRMRSAHASCLMWRAETASKSASSGSRNSTRKPEQILESLLSATRLIWMTIPCQEMRRTTTLGASDCSIMKFPPSRIWEWTSSSRTLPKNFPRRAQIKSRTR